MRDPAIHTGETVERLPGTTLSVLQKQKGYRFSIDAVLLAGCIRLRPGSRAMELGSGSGVISLILAARQAEVLISGIDIQEEMVDMSNRSALLNGFKERVSFACRDVREIRRHYEPGSYDVVFFNPPYRKVGSGRINPLREKAAARHEVYGTIDDFVGGAAFLLKEKGRVYVIYPASRSVGLIASLRQNGLEPKVLRFVHSEASSPAVFVLAEGIRGGGEEVTVMSPLVLFDAPGLYSAEVREMTGE
ncbi:MAG: methyltransferase domain-containing protein [Syntrophales bacterium]|jgi:tRNA1Val (adenine37-N6)-methyltransferase|nr:methyltransferase domain-containing protein [Syntrophales bacterium]MCK9527273.1 methyltransferase domain-containing protein [Syntrophales bacterium]MDX9921257.1 methyltransferase domain-containing protein [Syntrophales bacterium]